MILRDKKLDISTFLFLRILNKRYLNQITWRTTLMIWTKFTYILVILFKILSSSWLLYLMSLKKIWFFWLYTLLTPYKILPSSLSLYLSESLLPFCLVFSTEEEIAGRGVEDLDSVPCSLSFNSFFSYSFLVVPVLRQNLLYYLYCLI